MQDVGRLELTQVGKLAQSRLLDGPVTDVCAIFQRVHHILFSPWFDGVSIEAIYLDLAAQNFASDFLNEFNRGSDNRKVKINHI